MGLKEESRTLIEEMKQYLPIPAHFSTGVQRLLSQQGTSIDMDREVNIIDIIDSGDMGGIVCTIEGDEKEVLVISLTHLIIEPDHPLSDKIAAYQKKRVRRLRRYG